MSDPKVVTTVPAAAASGAVDKSNWEYVNIPALDLYDQPHPGVGINFKHYGPGKHLVSPEIAGEISERMRVFDRYQLRLMRPTADRKAIEVTSREGVYVDNN